MTDDAPQLSVETVSLGALARWPRNPKDHDLGALSKSFERFGYVTPILVNRRNKTILAGHGRLDALWRAYADGESPPGRVIDASTSNEREWLVPVVMVDLDEKLHEAYVVADNRLTELGGWDWGKLPEVLTDLAHVDLLEVTGFDRNDLDEMVRHSRGGPPEEFPDAAPGGSMEYHCPKCGYEWKGKPR